MRFRRRDAKADDKRLGNRQGGRKVLKLSSSESDSSDEDGGRHDSRNQRHRDDLRHKDAAA